MRVFFHLKAKTNKILHFFDLITKHLKPTTPSKLTKKLKNLKKAGPVGSFRCDFKGAANPIFTDPNSV